MIISAQKEVNKQLYDGINQHNMELIKSALDAGADVNAIFDNYSLSSQAPSEKVSLGSNSQSFILRSGEHLELNYAIVEKAHTMLSHSICNQLTSISKVLIENSLHNIVVEKNSALISHHCPEQL